MKISTCVTVTGNLQVYFICYSIFQTLFFGISSFAGAFEILTCVNSVWGCNFNNYKYFRKQANIFKIHPEGFCIVEYALIYKVCEQCQKLKSQPKKRALWFGFRVHSSLISPEQHQLRVVQWWRSFVEQTGSFKFKCLHWVSKYCRKKGLWQTHVYDTYTFRSAG